MEVWLSSSPADRMAQTGACALQTVLSATAELTSLSGLACPATEAGL